MMRIPSSPCTSFAEIEKRLLAHLRTLRGKGVELGPERMRLLGYVQGLCGFAHDPPKWFDARVLQVVRGLRADGRAVEREGRLHLARDIAAQRKRAPRAKKEAP